MTPRCQNLVDRVEAIISKYPDARRRFVGSLVLFLQVRKFDVYQEDLDCMRQVADQMRQYPQAEADLEILEVGADIAEVFPVLTDPESGDLDGYLTSLLTNFGDQLSKYLIERLGGKLEVFSYGEIPPGVDTDFDRLAMSFKIAKLNNDSIIEDFRLKFTGKFSREDILAIIRKYYEDRGFIFLLSPDKSAMMFEGKKEYLHLHMTYLTYEIIITVNSDKF